MDLESLRFAYLRRVVAPILSALPFSVVQTLTRTLARGAHSINTPGRRRAEARLARMAGSLHDSPAQIIEQMYGHIGRFWAEALHARRRLGESSWRRHVNVIDETNFASLQSSSSRTGCLFVTACLGNPAACAAALGHLCRPIHVLVDSTLHPILGAWQRDLLSFPNVRTIERRDAGRRLPQVFAQGGAVLMLCDSPRIRGKCVPTRFLGAAFRAHPSPGRFANWFNIPIAVVSCPRTERPCSFELHLHDTIRAGRDDSPDDVTRQTMSAIERAILTKPAQYLWSLPGGNDSSESGAAAEPRYAYGNLIGVVPKNTSKSVGLAKAVSGGQ